MSLSQVLQVPFAPSLYGVPGGVLLEDLNSTSVASTLGMVADDQFALQLFPRSLTSVIGSSTTSLQLSTGSTILFSIKTVAGIDGSTLLGESTNFTEYQDASSNWYYGSILNLTAAAVTAALNGAESVECEGEILITDATGSTKRYQFAITLYAAVYTGTEAAINIPAPGTVLSFLYGSQAIAANVDHATVTGLGLATVPSFIEPKVIKADGTHANIDPFLRAGWTTDGFTVDLSGLTSDGTYTLSWLIASSSGSVGSSAVPDGVDTITVPLALSRAPLFIAPVLVKAGAGEPNIRAFLRGGWTGAGFTVDLSGLTPDATYTLYYLFVP